MVHITSGVSALVCALYLGQRKAIACDPMRPHSLVLSTVGACLLWVGWFGFNAGSALAASPLATSAFVATHFGAAAAALGWMFAEWIGTGKPSVLGAHLGRGRRDWSPSRPLPDSSSRFPRCSSARPRAWCCYLMVTAVKQKFGYDDSLDAFGVHGVGGTLGAILTGVFATKEVNDVLERQADGLGGWQCRDRC